MTAVDHDTRAPPTALGRALPAASPRGCIRAVGSSSGASWPVRSAGWHRLLRGAVRPAPQCLLGEGRVHRNGGAILLDARGIRGHREQRGLPDHRHPHDRDGALVTVTDALLAFPIAYYMARMASPRVRGMLVIAVLLPLWAPISSRSTPGGRSSRATASSNGRSPVRYRGAGPRRDRQRLARPVLPVAAVHDPADLRRPGTDPVIAPRGLLRPRRTAVDDVPTNHPAVGLSGASWPARSSRSP